MSASDAAPLPRLGEVFFDVRGNSRSMRLSWYADTGVAVFSIWQGGMCTGTFRLPIGDLPRMIEVLQRGPHGHYPDEAGEHRGHGYTEQPYDADYGADYLGEHDAEPDYRADEYSRGGHQGGRYRQSDFSDAEYGPDENWAGEYRPDENWAGEYGRPEYRDAPDYYPDAGQRHARGPRDEDRYQPDATGQRFAPPYAGHSEYGFTADPGSGPRHSTGRHSSGQQ
jgi:hypothetical protein